MSTHFAPGSKIAVKVVKTPSNAAARKTIVRVLSRDKGIQAENARLYGTRKANKRVTVRGGRLRVWEGRLVKQHAIKGNIGDAGTFTCTLDVLTDLASVARFVEVSAA